MSIIYTPTNNNRETYENAEMHNLWTLVECEYCKGHNGATHDDNASLNWINLFGICDNTIYNINTVYFTSHYSHGTQWSEMCPLLRSIVVAPSSNWRDACGHFPSVICQHSSPATLHDPRRCDAMWIETDLAHFNNCLPSCSHYTYST